MLERMLPREHGGVARPRDGREGMWWWERGERRRFHWAHAIRTALIRSKTFKPGRGTYADDRLDPVVALIRLALSSHCSQPTDRNPRREDDHETAAARP